MYRLNSCYCRLVQSGLKTGSLLVRLGKLLLHSAAVLLLAFTINYLAKVLLFFFSCTPDSLLCYSLLSSSVLSPPFLTLSLLCLSPLPLCVFLSLLSFPVSSPLSLVLSPRLSALLPQFFCLFSAPRISFHPLLSFLCSSLYSLTAASPLPCLSPVSLHSTSLYCSPPLLLLTYLTRRNDMRSPHDLTI